MELDPFMPPELHREIAAGIEAAGDVAAQFQEGKNL